MGGGIFNMMGSLTVTNSTLAGNMAQGGGGNGCNDGNAGDALRGALFNLDGNATLTGVTIANDNVVAGTDHTPGYPNGSFVYNLAYGNNITTGGPFTATLTLNDTIIGQNSGPTEVGQTNDGADLVNDVDNGNNTDTAQINRTNSLVQGGAVPAGNGTRSSPAEPSPLPAPPKLATTFANTGGLTPTLSLLPSSPAIDSGNGSLSGLPSTDQRGYANASSAASIDIARVRVSIRPRRQRHRSCLLRFIRRKRTSWLQRSGHAVPIEG